MANQSKSQEDLNSPLSRLYAESELSKLLKPYQEALAAYLKETYYPPNGLPPCFIDPLLFFYAKKGINLLYSADGFYFGNAISYRITARTFPSFLRYHRLPEGSKGTRDRLLKELDALVRAYPYNERELLSKKAFRLDQGFTSYIEKNLKVSLKKNLYFPKLTNYNTGALALFPNTTILACPFEKPPVFSSAFLKQYLGAITRTPRKNAVETPELPDDCLLFYDKSAPADTPYRTLTAKSAPHLHQAEKPTLPTKVLVLDPLPSEAPEGAKTWLFKLTGGQLDLLDQLAALLARAASPTCSKNISVLYSAQNADILLDFLSAVLDPLISADMRNHIHSLTSINNYCRTSGLRRLFLSQETGAGVIFTKDTAISDTARPVLNKLLSGRSIPISIPGFPKQYLYNRNHFICVSSNLEKAVRLSKDLRAPLLDFSKYELPARLSISDLSEEDIQWLRCVFLPFGLLDHPLKNVRTKKVSTTWVEDFLNDCCSFQKDILCDRHDFYAAYCACYTARFPGKQAPLTLGQFCKAADHHLGKNIYYKKIRAKQRKYFKGIICTKNPSDIHPEPKETLLNQFRIHIRAIDICRPVWIPEEPVNGLPESVD